MCIFLETTETVLLAPEFPSVWDRPKNIDCTPKIVKNEITRIRCAIGANFKAVGEVKDISQFL
jgi:hypothetical protein